jgi:cytoskeletal protein RodZ
MKESFTQFKIQKKAGSKKLPKAGLFFASFSLLLLILGSKYIFAAASPTASINLQPDAVAAVLGTQTPQIQSSSENSKTTTATATDTTTAAPPPIAATTTPTDASSTPATAVIPAPILPHITEDDNTTSQKRIRITNTPTGYLNIRSQPSLSGSVIGKVYPGQTYTYSVTQDGWYLIRLKSSRSGWVDGQYITTPNNNSEEENE